MGTRLGEFYDELLNNPRYVQQTAKFRSIVAAYMRGMPVAQIADTFGVSRTEIALAIGLAGVERGMDAKSMAPDDVANLYACLYAAQLEIESLRRQLDERDH